MFGLGKATPDSSLPETKSSETTVKRPLTTTDTEIGSINSEETLSVKDAHGVEQSEVAVKDLQEAVQAEDEIELSWEKKDIWLANTNLHGDNEGDKEVGKGRYEKRRVAWIIVSRHNSYILIIH